MRHATTRGASSKVNKNINYFESPRLIYREICADDAENIVRWRSTPLIYKFFRKPKPLSLEEHLEWYKQKYLMDQARSDYIIIHRESKSPIGVISVSDLKDHTLQINYMIGESSYQKQGYAVESINAALDNFSKIGITHFFAEIHTNNIASIKTAEKCGFSFSRHLHENFLLYKKQ